jgi:ribosomal protein L18E
MNPVDPHATDTAGRAAIETARMMMPDADDETIVVVAAILEAGVVRPDRIVALLGMVRATIA